LDWHADAARPTVGGQRLPCHEDKRRRRLDRLNAQVIAVRPFCRDATPLSETPKMADAALLEKNYAPVWSLLSLAVFGVTNLLLRPLTPDSARENAAQTWKWRNTANSMLHSALTGVWALVCFYENPRMAEDLIGTYNTSSHLLVAVSVGYFIHDFIDMWRHHRKRSAYELMIHHICVSHDPLLFYFADFFTSSTPVPLPTAGQPAIGHRSMGPPQNGFAFAFFFLSTFFILIAAPLFVVRRSLSRVVDGSLACGTPASTHSANRFRSVSPRQRWFRDVIQCLEVISCFGLAEMTTRYIGYAVVALLVEVNSVFLHLRQLLIIQGVSRTSATYRLTSLLNIGTFLVFRIMTLGWMTRWLVLHRDQVPLIAYTLGSVALAVIVLMNIVLFFRILHVDFFKTKTKKETKE